MRTLVFLICTAILSASACVHADDSTELSTTRVQLEARTAAEVDNDSMRATLFAEVDDADASRAAERINQATRESVEALKNFPGLRTRTGGYTTFPVSENGRIVRWRARSEVVVEGQEFEQVSAAIGRVQSRMQLARVEFFVSPTRRAAAEAELTQAAIAEFLAKAGRVAQGFKGSGFHVAEASISSDGAPPPPRPMMRSMAAEAAAPQFEGGTSRVAVSVTGTVLILR
jgi:predicted secreted protein